MVRSLLLLLLIGAVPLRIGASVVVVNPGFEDGTGTDADDWIEEQYDPSTFVGEGDVGLVGPGCGFGPAASGPPFVSTAVRTTAASFSGTAAMELRAAVDCGTGGQFRWRAAATLADVDIPPGGDPHITFWARMAGEVSCSPTHALEGCFPFTCGALNYDAENLIGLLFNDTLGDPNSRQREPAESHGPHPGSCAAHVTETVDNGSVHHAFFATAPQSQPGTDGELWFRYTVPVPAAYLGQTIELSVLVDHFQNFASVGLTGVYVDEVALTDAAGQPLLCGDVDDDGDVDGDDVTAYRMAFADPNGSPLSPAGRSKCTVIPPLRTCDVLDATVVRRAIDSPSLGPGIEPVCAALTCTDDGFEDNDSLATAAAVVSPFVETELQVCSGDDDFYSIAVNAGDDVRVDLFFVHVDGDLDLHLFDPNGELVAVSASLTDDESIPHVALETGTYTCRVFAAAGGQTDYDIEVSATPSGCTDDGFEENDSLGAAFPVALPFDQLGLQICPGDDDYFSFSAGDGELILADASFLHANGNLDLHLFGPSGSLVALSASSTDDESIGFVVGSGQGGTYTLRVLGVPVAENGYDLSISSSP